MTRRRIPREDFPKTRTERQAASKPISLGEIRKNTWLGLALLQGVRERHAGGAGSIHHPTGRERI
jgi:hypothetical protein